MNRTIEKEVKIPVHSLKWFRLGDIKDGLDVIKNIAKIKNIKFLKK